jgi:hypothetical protein
VEIPDGCSIVYTRVKRELLFRGKTSSLISTQIPPRPAPPGTPQAPDRRPTVLQTLDMGVSAVRRATLNASPSGEATRRPTLNPSPQDPARRATLQGDASRRRTLNPNTPPNDMVRRFSTVALDDSPAPAEPTFVDRMGYMTKLGGKKSFLGESWRRRFFILRGATLTYSEGENQPVIRSITLTSGCGVKSVKAKDPARRDRFEAGGLELAQAGNKASLMSEYQVRGKCGTES